MIDRPSYLDSRRADVAVDTAEHTPSFHTRDIDEFIGIYDGDLFLATLSRESLYFDWREWYPDGRAGATDEIRRPYHNPSIRGTTIVNNWRLDGRQAVCCESFDISVGAEGGDTLTIRIDEDFGDSQGGHHELTVRYDADWGCYVLDYEAELALLKPHGIEFSNIWARGAGEFWPEDVDLHYVIWKHPEGLRYFPHNPLVPNMPGNMDHEGRRRIAVGGFLGIGARHRSNPVIEILASHTTALASGTCSCWYDEHIWMGCPGPIEADGKHHWRARYRIFSIPEALAKKLLDEAEIVTMGDTSTDIDNWHYLNHIRSAGRFVQPSDRSLALIGGQTTDFNTPIDPTAVLVGDYWTFKPQPWGRLDWDEDQAAIVIEGQDARADLSSGPCGPALMFHDGCNYRLSAEIRTDLAEDAAAWIQGQAFLHTPRDARGMETSSEVTGSTDWTPVEIVLEHGPEIDYMLIALRLRGAGRAWFRNILLEEIKD